MGEGYRQIKEITVDDMVASRDEYDVAGEVSWKRVEELFMRSGRMWELEVNGQVIRTTPEHPFYVIEAGKWLSAMALEIGCHVLGLHGEELLVTALQDTGNDEVVYNMRVAD